MLPEPPVLSWSSIDQFNGNLLQFQEPGTRSSETVMTRARGGLLAVAVAAASSTPVLPCHAWVLPGDLDLDPATAKTVVGAGLPLHPSIPYVLAYAPTEPFLAGVDVTPVV